MLYSFLLSTLALFAFLLILKIVDFEKDLTVCNELGSSMTFQIVQEVNIQNGDLYRLIRILP